MPLKQEAYTRLGEWPIRPPEPGLPAGYFLSGTCGVVSPGGIG